MLVTLAATVIKSSCPLSSATALPATIVLVPTQGQPLLDYSEQQRRDHGSWRQTVVNSVRLVNGAPLESLRAAPASKELIAMQEDLL